MSFKNLPLLLMTLEGSASTNNTETGACTPLLLCNKRNQQIPSLNVLDVTLPLARNSDRKFTFQLKSFTLRL